MLRDSLRELCQECRHEGRQNLRMRAKVQVGFDRFRPARTLDLSQHGARLEVDTSLAPGATLALNLTPEPMRQVAIRGEVVWTSPSWRHGTYEIGVRFQLASRADQAWLERQFAH